MRIYLASPRSQLQAHAVNDMPVLVSFGAWSNWMRDYVHTYSHLLIDSGAYSVLNSGAKLDVMAYRDWHDQWSDKADAVAGLDDIGGDYKLSLKNYAIGGGFPTMHDTDPEELLPELIDLSREQGDSWLGIGLKPPRSGKEAWIRDTLERIPKDIHIHGWALRAYAHLSRFGSMDSTNWWRNAFKIKTTFPFLTYGECVDISTKRYRRESGIRPEADSARSPTLFDERIENEP